MCFGGRKTREERKLCLKIHLFGFPQRLVTGQSTTAARKLVSPSTLIGGSCCQRAVKFKWTNQSWRWNHARALASGRCWLHGHKPLRKAEEVNFKATFSSVLHEFFGPRNTRIWSEIYWALWNCCFYCDSGLFLLRRKRFVEWGLASDRWSGWPSYSFSNGFWITSLNGVRMALNSAHETSSSHIWGRKTLFQRR